MYPGSNFNIIDQSQDETPVTPVTMEDRPLFMVVSSADKGPEDLMEIYGEDFRNLFGTLTFKKHGQNGIQAQNIIDAGGALLFKRVTAPDSALANVIFVATLTEVQSQKVNELGQLLYIGTDGQETTEVTETPATEASTGIKWEAQSVSNAKTFDDVKKAAEKLHVEGQKFPIFIIADNGKGESAKAVRLVPDYNTSKGIGKMFYTLRVYEGTTGIEDESISIDPTVVYKSTAYGLFEDTCEQVVGEALEDVFDDYAKTIADKLSLDIETVKGYDLVYGFDNKGGVINGLALDSEGLDLNASYGEKLKEGSNGSFGDCPANTEAWVTAIKDVWDGNVTDEIYDVDQHKIAAVVDANLPDSIKESISKFVTFREDCVFFRDLGLGLTTFIAIRDKLLGYKVKNRFISDYMTSYKIKDPSTKKNIDVTMMYDFAYDLVSHIRNNPGSPLAGTVNSFVLSNAIKGTINYTPRKTPSVDQKQAIDDLRVNYAIFEGDQCVVQTCYSSQDANTQLKYVNNMLAIQEVMRALRTYCPKDRYKFTTDGDLTEYAKACQNILSKFEAGFDTLNFEYTRDPLKISQKIFYASISLAFGMWEQTEIFDFYAINND